MAQGFMRTCERCGKSFIAVRGDARFCSSKSTCRVAASRARKAQMKAAKAITLEAEVYALYIALTKQYPVIDMSCRALLQQHGKEALTTFLVSFAQSVNYTGEQSC